MNNIDKFNIELLILTPRVTALLKPVTDLAIFESSSKTFNENGLFSAEIFGRVGTPERNTTFGYIDLNTSVIHPLVFKLIVSLKRFYGEIAKGNEYAVWDEKEKDFIKSNINDGDTGYDFFFKHIKDIKYKESKSKARATKIELIKSHPFEDLTVKKYLVYPAGLRDYTVDDLDRPSEDEVNSIYRKLLMYSNSLSNIKGSGADIKSLDTIRLKIQHVVVEIYDYFMSLIDGKKKLIQDKWSSRAIEFSTRNVITPMPSKIYDLDKTEGRVSYNTTAIGLYQYIKAINPITIYKLETLVLNKIFDKDTTSAKLIGKDSLTTMNVSIKTKTKDLWTSTDGLNGILNKMAQDEIQNDTVEVDGNYLALMYDDGKSIRLVVDTTLIPENIDRKYLKPVTYMQLFYYIIHSEIDKFPGLLTRYPITGLGSIYPSKPYVKTTLKGREVDLLGENWEKETTLYEYPMVGENIFGSLSPHYSHLQKLGGDYDGDKTSYVVLYTDEAINEVEKLLNDRKYYVTAQNNMTFSTSNDMVDIIAKTMSWQ